MIGGKRVLGLIPARGNSQRLPRKNVMPLGGKPLIVWTIEAAAQSGYVDRAIVSTDDQEIADVSRAHQGDVPFIRPDHLSTNEATTIDVAFHTIDYLAEQGESFDYLLLLQPTSPLRKSTDIDRAIELLVESESDSVVSVCEASINPAWCNVLPPSKRMDDFIDRDLINKRKQDLEPYYQLNGSIYLCDIQRLREEGTFFLKDRCVAYEMSVASSVDIDTQLDFDLAALQYERECAR